MFKSIQWKLVTMFLLLVLAVVIIAGTFLINSVTEYFLDDFINQMNQSFTEDFTDLLSDSLKTENPVQSLIDNTKIFSGRLGVDSYRNYYVLNKNGELQAGSSDGYVSFELSQNIITAMNGETGNSVNKDSKYMDYAYPVMDNGAVQYILYIRDTKEEISEISKNLFDIIINALLIGVLFSLIFGFFMSKTITSPITDLTAKAQRLAQGEFDNLTDVEERDEIGKLNNTFNFMAKTLRNTLEEMAGEKNKIETILKGMTDGVIAFNLEGKVIHINPAAENLLGIANVEAIEFDQFFADLNVDIKLGEFLYFDTMKAVEKRIDFNALHLAAYFAPFMTESEKAGVIVVLQDMTEMQRLDNVRREFVANVSHELKTPLTTVKSYSETIIESGAQDRDMTLSFLKVINNETDRMTRIVKDLLLLSGMDYSKVAWDKTEFDVSALIEEVVVKLRIEAQHRNQELQSILSTDLPLIYGDKDKIEQVLINVVSNAIKYTPEGGSITVSSGVIRNEIYIKVQDNGIGIPEKDLPRLFERFYRVDKARSRESGGTGLGLAIAKEIVDKHGGNITIESRLGEGTIVIIRLPAAGL